MKFENNLSKETIFHLIPNFIPGGAENQLKMLAKESRDFNHVIVSLKNVSKEYKRLNNGLNVIYMNIGDNPFNNIKSIIKLIIHIKKYKPKVINFWMYHTQLLSILLRVFYSTKYVWCIRHGSFSKYTKPTTVLISRINSFFSKLIPDLIIYNSEKGKLIHERKGYKKQNSIIIYNGGNDKFKFQDLTRNKQREEWDAANNCFVVGMVARYSPQKSIKLLIEVFGSCFHSNSNVKLVLCGRDMDKKNAELISLIKKEDIYSKTVLMGQSNDVNSVLNGLDLYLSMSSYGEGFPNILLEAKYTGLDIISTDVGDSKKILGKDDCIVKIGDSSSFIKNMRKKYSLYIKDYEYILIKRRKESYLNKSKFNKKDMIDSYEKEWRKLICT